MDVIDYFSFLKGTDALGPAYLLLGEGGSILPALAKIAVCSRAHGFCDSCWDCRAIKTGTHPDLFVLEPQGVFIKIEQVREAMKFLALKSFRARRKVLIINKAQNFTGACANAFLKTLEEPPANSFILLSAAAQDGILPTIISRCRRVFLKAADIPADCNFDLVARFFKNDKIKFANRGQFASFLAGMAVVLRDRLAVLSGSEARLGPCEHLDHFLSHLAPDKTAGVLGKVLEIHSVYNSVNENLALNLIRSEL